MNDGQESSFSISGAVFGAVAGLFLICLLGGPATNEPDYAGAGRLYQCALVAGAAVGGTIGFGLGRTKDRKIAARQLAGAGKPAPVKDLAVLLEDKDEEARTDAIHGLTKALPRMSPGEVANLSKAVRRSLYTAINMRDVYRHSDFLCILLEWVGRFGDAQAIPALSELASVRLQHNADAVRVVELARSTLSRLETRLSIEQGSSSLLRGSQPEEEGLLRPAGGSITDDSSALLRPGEPEDIQQQTQSF